MQGKSYERGKRGEIRKSPQKKTEENHEKKIAAENVK